MARHSRADGMDIAWREAWRQFGAKYWRWFVYGRLIVPASLTVLVVVGMWWTWLNVSHVMLGMGCAMAAAALLGYVLLFRLSLRARLMRQPSGTVTGLLLISVAVLVGAAAVAMYW